MMTVKRLQFLLVEDDNNHAEFVTRALKRNNATRAVDRVVDGVEALAYLRHQDGYADRPRPDVILLDLKLPKLDGHEVLAAVKSDPQLSAIPVVVLTTSDASVDRVRAYRHHVNSYLVKPLDFSQFRKMMDDVCLYWGKWNRAAWD